VTLTAGAADVMAKQRLNIGLVGCGFMGRTHSNAFRQVSQFFDTRYDLVLKAVCARTRPAAEAVAVAEALGAELLPMGSAGAKAMAVVRGAADIYLHTGGQYEWDNCAPAAVALAAGFHASRADGSPLVYNQPNPYLPDLLLCRPSDAQRILRILEERKQAVLF